MMDVDMLHFIMHKVATSILFGAIGSNLEGMSDIFLFDADDKERYLGWDSFLMCLDLSFL